MNEDFLPAAALIAAGHYPGDDGWATAHDWPRRSAREQRRGPEPEDGGLGAPVPARPLPPTLSGGAALAHA